jgi:hypothetical protein
LESQLTKYADQVWWFTEGALHYAKVRNPNLNTPDNAHGFMVLPGAEPPGGLPSAKLHNYSEKLNLCHFTIFEKAVIHKRQACYPKVPRDFLLTL